MQKLDRFLLGASAIAFAYALIGNYVALPGYLHFLERGGRSEAGNAFDLAVLIGATKTIAWMLAFNVAALCLYVLGIRHQAPSYSRLALVIAVSWLSFWLVPVLPKAHWLFFVLFGTVILAMIYLAGASGRVTVRIDERGRFLVATSLYFFALATWDVCGLGSTGRILDPEQVVLARSQALLSTQTTKLMLAFLLAWTAMALALIGSGRLAGKATQG